MTAAMAGSHTVRLRSSPPGPVSRPRRSGASARQATVPARRFTAWMVRVIMLATSAVALLDLYLLASSAHH